jgi:hypothetical protein
MDVDYTLWLPGFLGFFHLAVQTVGIWLVEYTGFRAFGALTTDHIPD